MSLARELLEGDLVPSLGLLLLLFFVGHSVIRYFPEGTAWGRRCGCIGGLTYVVFRGLTLRLETATEVTTIVIRGLLAAGYATVLAWIIAPLVGLVWNNTFGALLRSARQFQVDMTRRWVNFRTNLQREQAERLARQQHDWAAPAREQAQAEAAVREAQVAEVAAAAQQRREDARLRAELLYERHSRQLTSSFPRDRFEQFLSRYMNDQLPPEAVEQREQLLQAMVVESLGTTSQFPKFKTLAELAAYFEGRREEISRLNCDQVSQGHYRVQLNDQEDQALRRFFQS